MSESLTEILNKVDEEKSTIKMVKSLKGDLNDSKNFKYKKKKITLDHIPIPDGQLTTMCKQSGVTCHDDCGCYNEHKYNFCAIRANYCIVCKNKCHWSVHINVPYIIKEKIIEEEAEFEDLKKKYSNLQEIRLEIVIDIFLKVI